MSTQGSSSAAPLEIATENDLIKVAKIFCGRITERFTEASASFASV